MRSFMPKEIAIPLHDSGCLYVSSAEFKRRVRDTGSEVRARQSFLRDAYIL